MHQTAQKYTRLVKSTARKWSKSHPIRKIHRRMPRRSAQKQGPSGQKPGMLKSGFQGDELFNLKCNETRRCKPRKGGVSCSTFKCTYIVKRIFSCVYIGVSGGHKLAIGGTLTRLQTGPKAISSSRRARNSKLIIEEQCENSPQKRAKDKPPNATKIAVKCTVKSAPKKKGPKLHFIHAGLAQIDFEAEFAKVVKNPLGGSPH